MSDSDGPNQVDSPNDHHESHTAAQTCGWTANERLSKPPSQDHEHPTALDEDEAGDRSGASLV
ncbi:hypothetical protein [Haladaptatus sp. NG-SE-30]